MNTLIIATKNCAHCKNFSHELEHLNIDHQIIYAEDEPELCEKLNIRHSPNLVVDNEVIFRHLPGETELKAFFNR